MLAVTDNMLLVEDLLASFLWSTSLLWLNSLISCRRKFSWLCSAAESLRLLGSLGSDPPSKLEYIATSSVCQKLIQAWCGFAALRCRLAGATEPRRRAAYS
jgi:hypothetical protein